MDFYFEISSLYKVLISLVIVVPSLWGISLLYYNLPVYQKTDNPAVDYSLSPDSPYSKFSEGAFVGKTNNEGMISDKVFTEESSVDVLVMGSSYMRGVSRVEDTIACKLETLLNDKTVYSIATANHGFAVTVKNLPAAIERYKPEYVVLEYVPGDNSEFFFQCLLQGKMPEQVISGQRTGFMHQLRDVFSTKLKAVFFGQKEKTEGEYLRPSNETLVLLFQHIGNYCKQVGVKLVIVYQPRVLLQPRGDLLVKLNSEERSILTDVCRDSGIVLVDMTQRFADGYIKEHVLPYGFSNTAVGTGHLNNYGNTMVAEEISKAISNGMWKVD